MSGTTSATPTNAIEARGLTKCFGGTTALRNLDLIVSAGSVVALLGRNGAGRTTALKLMAGLLRPTEGTVEVLGLNPVQSPERVFLKLGYVPQRTDLPGDWTVSQLLTFNESFFPHRDRATEADYLRRFNLDRAQRVGKLSASQQKQVSLLLALLQGPELFVLDEPSAGLDPVERREFLPVVKGQQRTIVFSTNLIEEALLADRVVILHRGKVVLDCTPDDIPEDFRRLDVHLSLPRSESPSWKGVLAWEKSGDQWTVLCSKETVIEAAEVTHERAATLNEVFFALTKDQPATPAEY